ncbi:hypothetical protein [Novosphingobium album (ex Hu et al. 2023)]|uniref:PilZ domain-containing protein n=1 Tax=Novosphingobium album (ex Hu et al. 2023) TaxID=2930093 RepID=A0ABT0B503_9SPHN|nr:hypothetical protein [Novosphingobium album (ex Hu et al. 2023)]MCJ2179971.1 hypothetical protein [Novosphingobium album (ex Hu et al. 2023)]
MALHDPAESPAAFHPGERRHQREQVEMMARFRRDLASSTVMLKDLTPFGARIEGIGPLQTDEAVSLALPGCRPAIAFVAWANDHCAGLEFAEPLENDIFAELVASYGLGLDSAAAA